MKYGPGGFNALHRELRGSVFFPIQMAIVLSKRAESDSPETEGFRGGEFLLCNVPERKKSRRRELPAGLGDAVLFCTRDRLVRVGGVYGLQPVKHGAARVTAGTRFVLGVPFHEYR
ncbi:MAG: 2OG-Fe(II) oxygenase [Planctomycetia bacterium]|nr:2OG-Fe(II) oxygenase [Planctomycetia bacterium]